MSVPFDSDPLFLQDNLLYSSGLFCGLGPSLIRSDDPTTYLEHSGETTEDLWEQLGMLPTPPVSPLREQDMKATGDEDLDLGLNDLLGMDIPDLLDCGDWLTDEMFQEEFPLVFSGGNGANSGSVGSHSSVHHGPSVGGCHQTSHLKCDVGELRHDCMWAGLCPSEEHKQKKELLPLLLGCSPPATETLSRPPREIRVRLDTLGSLRPETPSSLSDSELDADQVTSPGESCDEAMKAAATSSEEDEEEEEEEESDDEMHLADETGHYHHPTTAVAVRQVTKNGASLVKCHVKSTGPNLPDHSYSHSDHSYHTQRRPNDSAADQLGIQTPSDSEEEIDVVSLGEVLRVAPGTTTTTTTTKAVHVSTVSAAAQSAAANGNPFTAASGPVRLKVKVAPAVTTAASGAAAPVFMRKALPSHPSALVRQQLQLAVASAAQQRKQTEQQQQQQQQTVRKILTVSDARLTGINHHQSGGNNSNSIHSHHSSNSSNSLSSARSNNKRNRVDNSGSSNSSPRKRSSRTGSDSEDSCEKRSQHNSMERQRRVDLRNAFEFLRSLIPDLEATDRAAKVVILKKAAQFCQGLTAKEKQFISEKDALQKRQEMLKKRLALLQRRR